MDLAKILREHGMTQVELGRRLGKAKQTINSVAKNPTLSSLETIAQVLDIPVYRMFITEEELDKLSKINLDTIYDTEEALGIKKGSLINDPDCIRNIAEVIDKVERLLKLEPNTLFISGDTLGKRLARREKAMTKKKQ